jgi:hypothetical protein
MKKENIYAIYKGDDFVYMGTKKECAEHLGVMPRTICFYTTPTYRSRFKDNEDSQRIVVLKVEDIED